MRSTLMTITALMALPAAVFAHAGHAGHELPATVTPMPTTGPDHLIALALVVGFVGCWAVWRKLRRHVG